MATFLSIHLQSPILLFFYFYFKVFYGSSNANDTMEHVFITPFIGSFAILLVKWRFQPMIKLISSFMFGAGFITATGMAFSLVYIVTGNI